MSTAVAPTEIRDTTDRLAHLLGRLDLGGLLPGSLPALIALGERIERLGHGLKTRAAARIADTAVWRGDGDRSPEDGLARQTGTAKADAGRLVDTGRQLEALPVVAEAVTRGELSARQAEAIAGAAAADPGAQSRLVDQAKGGTLRELQDECRRTRANADPDPDAAARRAHAKRSCRTWTDPDGVTGHLHLSGPVTEMARVDNAMRHRADHTALVRGRALDGETCEIAGVAPIPVGTVREWLEDAFVAVVLTQGDDVQKVVHLGRRFKATQRTALQWQDPICARQGCTNRLRLEYDHFEDWATTHTTRVPAAKRFCHPCHQLKSRGWRVSEPDANGQCTFTPPPTHQDIAAADAAATATQRRRRGTGPSPPPADTG